MGVLALLLTLSLLFILPIINRATIRSSGFKPAVFHLNFNFLQTLLFLAYLGACPLSEPYLTLAFQNTVAYFLYFVLLPLHEVGDKLVLKATIYPVKKILEIFERESKRMNRIMKKIRANLGTSIIIYLGWIIPSIYLIIILIITVIFPPPKE